MANANPLNNPIFNENFNSNGFLENGVNHLTNPPQPPYPPVPSGNQVDIFAAQLLSIKYYIDEYNKIKDKTQNKSKIILLLIDATKYLDFLVSKKDIQDPKIYNLKDDIFNTIINKIKIFLNNPNWETYVKLYSDYPTLKSVLMLENIKDLTKYQDFVELLKLYQTWLIIQWVLINPTLLYTTSPMASQWKVSGGMNKTKKHRSRTYKSKKYKSKKLIKKHK